MREICLALRPIERVAFTGKPASKGLARTGFQKESERMHSSQFRVELPWNGFSISEWDASSGVVTLSTERPFKALNNTLALFDVGREEIELDAVKSEIEKLETGLNKGNLTLALVFRAAEEEGSPCVMSKAKTYAFAMDLIGAELRSGGKPVARAVRDGLEAIPSSSGKPTIDIRLADEQMLVTSKPARNLSNNGAAALSSVTKMRPRLIKCYESSLERNSSLEGSIVVDAANGSVIAENLNDKELATCANSVLESLRSPSKNGEHLILLEFGKK